MLTAVSDAITTVLGWVGTTITALTSDKGALHELLPLFAITVSVSAIMLGIRVIRGFVWGA